MHNSILDTAIINGCCLQQAWYNQSHGYKKLGLRIVLGSLGLGGANLAGDEVPFFEFGGRNHKEATQFFDAEEVVDSKGRIRLAAHVWLEDDQGGIYDMMTGVILEQSKKRGKTIIAHEDQIFEKVSYQHMALIGLHYVPAPLMCQSILLKMAEIDWTEDYHSKIMPMFNPA